MSKVKKQHFVPQFYLKNFLDPRSSIYVFDIINQKQFSTTTANIAHEKLFYDYKPLEEFVGQKQALERAFANMESEAAEYFKKLIAQLETNNIGSLTRDDYRQLANFITTQERRTPETLKQIDGIVMSMGYELEYDIQFEQINLLFHEEVLKVVEDWCDRYWIFWRNKTKYNFYTSDHPIVRDSHKEQKCEEIFFPITPKYAVSIFFKDGLGQQADNRNVRELIDPEEVKHYNFLMVTQCNRQVYSAENDFRFAKKLIHLNSGLTNPNRPRFVKKPLHL